MTRLSATAWEIAACLTGAALLGAGAWWYTHRKRPTPEELELARRQLLVESGRIVDGMLLDVWELDGADSQNLTMLLFSYRIGGVDYECSQDITVLRNLVDLTQVRAGFPCSVRYQPGNPQNSIVFAENWSGMRMGVPAMPIFGTPKTAERRVPRAKPNHAQTQA
ncbi:MAG TPA: hypothetical protein VLZ50_10610 [Terracidiphilus sp.]|nr:hypothetical protein [Terracidiphilus sp.]